MGIIIFLLIVATLAVAYAVGAGVYDAVSDNNLSDLEKTPCQKKSHIYSHARCRGDSMDNWSTSYICLPCQRRVLYKWRLALWPFWLCIHCLGVATDWGRSLGKHMPKVDTE